MALPSGLAAQFGVSEETTWGTRVAPTRFYEITDESMSLDVDRVESKALRAAQRVLRSDRWVSGKHVAGGSVNLEVHNKNFGLLLKHMLGAVASSQPNAGTAPTVWEHKATLGDLAGKGLTVQVGRPDVGGTVDPFDYVGSKVVGWQISQELDALMMLGLTLDSQDELTNQSLATASYVASTTPFAWTNLAVQVNSIAFNCNKLSLQGDMAFKGDRYFMGSVTGKEPRPNGFSGITGEIDGEFESLTAYNRFVNGTIVPITMFWTGALIAATFSYAVEITLPACRFDGDTPQVSGPDIVPQPLKFKVLDDGSASAPIQIVYRTIDTTP